MEAIYIPHLLKAPDRTRIIVLNDMIEGLETLTPVRGKLLVRHGGNFLDIAAQAETILTLTCDRCLRQFNHRLALDTAEIIWLEESTGDNTYPAEREIAWEDLSETLPEDGHFDPELWLYEQLSLALPLRQLCGENCQAPSPGEPETPSLFDSRWSSLEGLKKNL